MIHNYNANLDTRENRELLNRIFQIQLVKDKFYVPNDIQPNIFRHDLLFGQVREGEGSDNNMRQFSLPVEGIGAIYSGNSGGGGMSGGALVSNGRLASHEAIYLDDENERGHAKRQTPFLGKRGEPKGMSGGDFARDFSKGKKYQKYSHGGVPMSVVPASVVPVSGGNFARFVSHPTTVEKGRLRYGGVPAMGVGAGKKKGGSVAIKSAIKQKVSEKIKALPMKKLTGQFSILNKVI